MSAGTFIFDTGFLQKYGPQKSWINSWRSKGCLTAEEEDENQQ
jgi:hypothetical protein